MKDEILRIRVEGRLKEKVKLVEKDMSKYVRRLIVSDLRKREIN